MADVPIAEATASALAVDVDAFDARVREDAEVVKRELAEGTFDNPQGIAGLEYEFYAVADPAAAGRWRADGEVRLGELRRIPRRLLDYVGFEKELGLHNAESSTRPQPANRYGLPAQEHEVRAHLANAAEAVRAEGIRLVSDGVWTVPPAGETARSYLADHVVDDGLRIAANMSEAPRYHAMANSPRPLGMAVDLPHVSFEAPTVMPESLITSIQPHYQLPHAADLPAYHRYALRVAPALVALAANSPFVPPDLYDPVDPAAILADAWMEGRIRIFETSMNGPDAEKVRFPEDVPTVEAAVDRIADDPTVVPMPVERGERFDDRFAHLRTKHGTYWRWVRPVFDGASRSSANARLEFRPLPAQPTVRDSVALQAAYVGLLEGLFAGDHPLRELPWGTARDDFYAAARDGLRADLHWVDADGERLEDTEAIYDDLLAAAGRGLRSLGLGDDAVERYLRPLEVRVERDVTPARWKHRRVAAALEEGHPLDDAIGRMQAAYLGRQRETLLEGSFEDWLDGTDAPG